MDDLKSQVEKFYFDIWNKKRLEEIPNVLDPNVVFTGSLGDQAIGHQGFEEYLNTIHVALSDYQCDIEDIVIEGNKAFAKMLFSGKHVGDLLGFSPTHREVSWSAAALFTFDRDKVVRLWVLGDVASLKQQLNENLVNS